MTEVPRTSQGRVRPKLTPREVKCSACGGMLLERSDDTRFVVCRYCNAHLELGQVEARVLSKAAPRHGFDYAIDDAFVWNGGRYVVAARMVFTQSDEDGASETIEYLLWSPRRGTLYLDFDDGRWLLSRMVHVMPRCDDPFALAEGASVSTYDGDAWTFVESGTGTLAYVDGSLPWVATVGDRVQYATFRAAHDGHKLYEVERDAGETEFCEIRVVSQAELRAAAQTKHDERSEPPDRTASRGDSSGNPSEGAASEGERSGNPSERVAEGAHATTRWFLWMALVAAVFCLTNLALASQAAREGRVVLTKTIVPGLHPPPAVTPAPPGAPEEDPDDLETGDVIDNSPPDPEEPPIVGGVELNTDSFQLPAKSLLRIDLAAPTLNEAWASIDLALVYGDDLATHILDGDLAHYNGDEDDPEEGPRTDTILAWIEQPGTYHFLVRVMGAKGDTETPGDIPVPVTITATTDARAPSPLHHMAIVSGIAAAVLFGIFLIRRPRAKEEAA